MQSSALLPIFGLCVVCGLAVGLVVGILQGFLLVVLVGSCQLLAHACLASASGAWRSLRSRASALADGLQGLQVASASRVGMWASFVAGLAASLRVAFRAVVCKACALQSVAASLGRSGHQALLALGMHSSALQVIAFLVAFLVMRVLLCVALPVPRVSLCIGSGLCLLLGLGVLLHGVDGMDCTGLRVCDHGACGLAFWSQDGATVFGMVGGVADQVLGHVAGHGLGLPGDAVSGAGTGARCLPGSCRVLGLQVLDASLAAGMLAGRDSDSSAFLLPVGLCLPRHGLGVPLGVVDAGVREWAFLCVRGNSDSCSLFCCSRSSGRLHAGLAGGRVVAAGALVSRCSGLGLPCDVCLGDLGAGEGDVDGGVGQSGGLGAWCSWVRVAVWACIPVAGLGSRGTLSALFSFAAPLGTGVDLSGPLLSAGSLLVHVVWCDGGVAWCVVGGMAGLAWLWGMGVAG